MATKSLEYQLSLFKHLLFSNIFLGELLLKGNFLQIVTTHQIFFQKMSRHSQFSAPTDLSSHICHCQVTQLWTPIDFLPFLYIY